MAGRTFWFNVHKTVPACVCLSLCWQWQSLAVHGVPNSWHWQLRDCSRESRCKANLQWCYGTAEITMTAYAGIVLTDICFLLLLTSNELTRKGHLYNNSVNLDICGQHLFVTTFIKPVKWQFTSAGWQGVADKNEAFRLPVKPLLAPSSLVPIDLVTAIMGWRQLWLSRSWRCCCGGGLDHQITTYVGRLLLDLSVCHILSWTC